MGRSPYVLSEPEKLALESIRSKGDDVIASGPWLKGPHELPHRVVLRRTDREYIVHLQIVLVEQHRAFFEHGNYFPTRTKEEAGESLAKAWAKFDERVRHHLAIVPTDHESEEDESDDQTSDRVANPRVP